MVLRDAWDCRDRRNGTVHAQESLWLGRKRSRRKEGPLWFLNKALHGRLLQLVLLLELVLHLPCRRSLLWVLSELRINVVHPGVLESREIILVELRARVEFLEGMQPGHIAEHVVRHGIFNSASFGRARPKFEVEGGTETQEESGLDRSESNIGWGRRGRCVCSSTRWSVLSMLPISVTEMIGYH